MELNFGNVQEIASQFQQKCQYPPHSPTTLPRFDAGDLARTVVRIIVARAVNKLGFDGVNQQNLVVKISGFKGKTLIAWDIITTAFSMIVQELSVRELQNVAMAFQNNATDVIDPACEAIIEWLQKPKGESE